MTFGVEKFNDFPGLYATFVWIKNKRVFPDFNSEMFANLVVIRPSYRWFLPTDNRTPSQRGPKHNQRVF